MEIEGRLYIVPDWPAPAVVRAVSTTRSGGGSEGSFASFNLGLRAGDDQGVVTHNRRLLGADLRLPAEPLWLRQQHGSRVAVDGEIGLEPAVDASVTTQRGRACVVLTADCLPVLMCSDDGDYVGAAHAGWKGAAGGVLENTVAAIPRSPETIIAWLGPCIGPEMFEVGDEVREIFVAGDPECGHCFRPSPRGRWLADLPELARRRLRRVGVTRLYGSGGCTHSEPARYFSYRRDRQTGRMASLIWIAREA